jgi:hypothetical protein
VVPTPHHEGLSRGFLQDGKGAVSTDIVECADLSVFAFDEDERVSCYVESAVVSRSDEM